MADVGIWISVLLYVYIDGSTEGLQGRMYAVESWMCNSNACFHWSTAGEMVSPESLSEVG